MYEGMTGANGLVGGVGGVGGYPNYSSLTPLSATSNSPPAALTDYYSHAAMSYGTHSAATTAL